MIDSGGGSAIEMWLSEDDVDVTSSELQREVWEELRAEPGLESCLAAVAVYVTGTEATLLGVVPQDEQKAAAARAASRVRGIARVVNSIRIELPTEP